MPLLWPCFLEHIEAKSIKELCKLCSCCCVEQFDQRFSLFIKKRARPACFIYNYTLYIEWRNEWLNRAKCRPHVERKMGFHNTSEITGLYKWWHKTLLDKWHWNLFRVVKCTVLANINYKWWNVSNVSYQHSDNSLWLYASWARWPPNQKTLFKITFQNLLAQKSKETNHVTIKLKAEMPRKMLAFEVPAQHRCQMYNICTIHVSYMYMSWLSCQGVKGIVVSCQRDGC